MEPKLIHPVKVIYRNIKEGNFNPVFREREGQLEYEDPVEILSQVKYNSFKKVDSNIGGFELKGDGYLLMKKPDAENIRIKAKVERIDDDDVDFYISDKTPASVYGTARLMKVYFKTKEKGQG